MDANSTTPANPVNLDTRLKQSLAVRDRLSDELHKLEIRREIALKSFQEVEADIRAKGIDPDKIDQAVADLEAAYSDALTKFELDLKSLDQTLAPYRAI